MSITIIPGSQNDLVLRFLQAGNTLTHREARRRFRCDRLAARCFELRGLGFQIESTIVELPNKKRIARYSLKQRVRK